MKQSSIAHLVFSFHGGGKGRPQTKHDVWSDKDLNWPTNAAESAAYLRFLCAEERYFVVDK